MRYIVIRKRPMYAAAALVLVLMLLVYSVVTTGSAAVFMGKTTRMLPIYCVGTEEKKVALTFDAAWGADYTQRIIDTLTENDCKATFFLVGFWARKYPDMVKKIDEAGLEIGTHTNTHPHMPQLSQQQMRLELTASSESIREITGKEINLFRPPFGDYSNKMLTVCNDMNLKTIQWDVDSLDWKELSAGEITQRVLKRVKSGSIILFHNNGLHTADALPAIIAALRNKGYAMTTVGDLLIKGSYFVDNGGVMRPQP